MPAEEKTHIEELQKRLGYRFNDPQILLRALTHSSWRHETLSRNGRDPLDNESQEFLGDALIGFYLARTLFRLYPESEEGFLTRARAHLVSTRALSSIARELKLGRCLRLGRGESSSGGADKDSILENTLEAIVAAVLLDGGFDTAEQVLDRIFETRIHSLGVRDVLKGDSKSRLQEWFQARGLSPPTYVVKGETGKDHQKRFLVAVYLGGTELARAGGGSKKEAQREAARMTLEKLAREGMPEGIRSKLPGGHDQQDGDGAEDA